MPRTEALYEIDRSRSPPSCLPVGLDRSNLIAITCVGDPWQKYLDIDTNEIHDSAMYFERAQATMELYANQAAAAAENYSPKR
jgi:hypothetical protein